MRTVTIKAIEAVRCIPSGMTDAALMEELGISSGGLRTLFQQLLAAGLVTKEEMEDRLALSHASVVVGTEKKKIEVQDAKKPVIDAADAINCIRSGITDSVLMKRYNLSVKGMQSLFEKLVAAKLITWTEIERRSNCCQHSFVLDEEAGRRSKNSTTLGESDATEILRRLRCGDKSSDILDAYEISRSRLCHVLGEMAERGLATPGELEAYLAESSAHFQIRRRGSAGLIYSGSAVSRCARRNGSQRGNRSFRRRLVRPLPRTCGALWSYSHPGRLEQIQSHWGRSHRSEANGSNPGLRKHDRRNFIQGKLGQSRPLGREFVSRERHVGFFGGREPF